jgi:predicted permease
MGIPLVRGRLFDERDTRDGPHVAVISESLAKTRWPGDDPIGKLIEYGNMDGDVTPVRIVGIVGDIRDHGLGTEPEPTFYGYALQRPNAMSHFTYVLRSDADPARVIAAARRIVHDLAPDVPPRFRTLDQIFSASLAPRRVSLLLLGVFGCTALLLALMGIYGVVSYWVSQRTQEIGVRMALGATSGRVLQLVLWQAAVLALVGIGVGVAIAVPATRVLQSQLYGISATDPPTFVAVVALLVAAALVASYLPARKAAHVDPMEALRAE